MLRQYKICQICISNTKRKNYRSQEKKQKKAKKKFRKLWDAGFKQSRDCFIVMESFITTNGSNCSGNNNYFKENILANGELSFKCHTKFPNKILFGL